MSNVIPLRTSFSDAAHIADFLNRAGLTAKGWLALSPAQKRSAIERMRAQYPVDRVVAMIDAYCRARANGSALRPAGDATGTDSGGSPWVPLLFMAAGLALFEGLKYATGAHLVSEHLPRHNPRTTTNYCDYGHTTDEEIRYLPIGSEARAQLCHTHYLKEIAARSPSDPRGKPSWASLKIASPKIHPALSPGHKLPRANPHERATVIEPEGGRKLERGYDMHVGERARAIRHNDGAAGSWGKVVAVQQVGAIWLVTIRTPTAYSKSVKGIDHTYRDDQFGFEVK